MSIWDKITKAAAGLAGAIAGFFGAWSALLTLLACAMTLDYLSGLIVAWRGRSPKTEGGGLSSGAGFDGLAKKAIIIAIVLLATLLDRAIGGAAVFQTAAACYYLANEGLSILENAALMGVPFPLKIKLALEALKKSGDGDQVQDQVQDQED